ncbi:MAG: TraY domain-containing protein [Leucobacter sp.]|nr:TraY domain-containing protein [Leucobacter sp.]
MSHTLTLRLPDDLSGRLDRLAESTSRSKSFYVRTLIEDHISELEYVAGIDAYAEAVRKGEVETRPMDELIDELGFDRDELIAEGHRELSL